jgi:hypothetical protein
MASRESHSKPSPLSPAKRNKELGRSQESNSYKAAILSEPYHDSNMQFENQEPLND